MNDSQSSKTSVLFCAVVALIALGGLIAQTTQPSSLPAMRIAAKPHVEVPALRASQIVPQPVHPEPHIGLSKEDLPLICWTAAYALATAQQLSPLSPVYWVWMQRTSSCGFVIPRWHLGSDPPRPRVLIFNEDWDKGLKAEERKRINETLERSLRGDFKDGVIRERNWPLEMLNAPTPNRARSELLVDDALPKDKKSRQSKKLNDDKDLQFRSEDLRQIPEFIERFWPLEMPDIAQPYKVNGKEI